MQVSHCECEVKEEGDYVRFCVPEIEGWIRERKGIRKGNVLWDVAVNAFRAFAVNLFCESAVIRDVLFQGWKEGSREASGQNTVFVVYQYAPDGVFSILQPFPKLEFVRGQMSRLECEFQDQAEALERMTVMALGERQERELVLMRSHL